MHGIMVMACEVKPKRTIRRQIEERTESGLCLHCEKEAARRGLCNSHYHQFRMTWLQQPKAERSVWLANQIHEGRVLETRQGQRLDLHNPFEDEE